MKRDAGSCSLDGMGAFVFAKKRRVWKWGTSILFLFFRKPAKTMYKIDKIRYNNTVSL
ncbi:hypothetical protein HFM94_13105 [Faecalicatena fissicatena]|nr:hypothetical protein [Faecalicatena fissicatena]